jgi:hypothetical protein
MPENIIKLSQHKVAQSKSFVLILHWATPKSQMQLSDPMASKVHAPAGAELLLHCGTLNLHRQVVASRKPFPPHRAAHLYI